MRILPRGRDEFAAKKNYGPCTTLVDPILEPNKQKHSGKLAPSELDHVEREITSTDAQIDDLVYELYGITDEERKIIES